MNIPVHYTLNGRAVAVATNVSVRCTLDGRVRNVPTKVSLRCTSNTKVQRTDDICSTGHNWGF